MTELTPEHVLAELFGGYDTIAATNVNDLAKLVLTRLRDAGFEVRSAWPPSSAESTDDTKLVYVKRWRTLVKLPAKYADEIVQALRVPDDAQAEAVQDTYLVGGPPDLKAMSGSVDDDRIIQLHFRRPATDKDREWMLEAINAKHVNGAPPQTSLLDAMDAFADKKLTEQCWNDLFAHLDETSPGFARKWKERFGKLRAALSTLSRPDRGGENGS
jgi:hypothetical protein